jgi:phosphate transport system substrate-binding protein
MNTKYRPPASSFRALMACSLLIAVAKIALAEELKIGGAGPLLGTMELLAEAYNKTHPGHSVEVVPRDKNNKPLSMGTQLGIRTGIEGQYNGKPFVGFVSEHVSDEQRKSGAQSIEVARVALVFVVPSSAPPLENITTQQVIDIYSRKMREWKPGDPVYLVRRPLQESDNTILIDRIPQLRPFITALVDPTSDLGRGLPRVANDAQESAAWIAEHRGAFGTSSMNLIITEKRALKPLKLNGVEPSPSNVLSNEYPLQKRVCLVFGKNVTPEMMDFINFVRTSKESRQIFSRTGHVFTSDTAGR